MTTRPAGTTEAPPVSRPGARAVLAHVIVGRRSVSACDPDNKQRLFCPHVLGSKAGRVTLLASQPAPATTHSATVTDLRQQRRSLFVDEMNDPALTDHAWQTADNDTPDCNEIDEVEIDVSSHARPQEGVAALTSRSGPLPRGAPCAATKTARLLQALLRAPPPKLPRSSFLSQTTALLL